MRYGISARDYLLRARDCLAQEQIDMFFYAAFELRAGVESRLFEYLEDQKHVSKKLKRGWQIAVLAKGVQQAFQSGDACARFAYCDTSGKNEMFVLYYIPVSRTLQNSAQRLGDYLHHQRKYRSSEDDWWTQFRRQLHKAENLLRQACTGTMVGPPLLQKSTGRVNMRIELPTEGRLSEYVNEIQAGCEFVARVSYSEKCPEEFEENAVIWKPDV